jgi:Helix-turn-helix domain
MTIDMKRLGCNLRVARRAARVTMTDAAKKAEMSLTEMALLEYGLIGKDKLYADQLWALCDLYDADADELLGHSFTG